MIWNQPFLKILSSCSIQINFSPKNRWAILWKPRAGLKSWQGGIQSAKQVKLHHKCGQHIVWKKFLKNLGMSILALTLQFSFISQVSSKTIVRFINVRELSMDSSNMGNLQAQKNQKKHLADLLWSQKVSRVTWRPNYYFYGKPEENFKDVDQLENQVNMTGESGKPILHCCQAKDMTIATRDQT